MKTKTCISILLAIILLFCNSYAQQTIVPPSSTASSLGQSTNAPVSLQNGTVSVNIPIWNVKSSRLKVPISISYNASGIKPGQAKGLPGTGWSLNAGGMISRTVRGLPDEDSNGWLNRASEIPFTNFTSELPILKELATGELDDMPDLYYFSFPGYSGKFVFDANGIVRTIPYTPLKIEKISNTKFAIITPGGTICTFGGNNNSVLENELTIKKYSCPEDTNCAYLPNQEYNCNYHSEWYLTSIETADKEDTITFSYIKTNDEYTENYGDNVKIDQYVIYARADEVDDGPPSDHHVENVTNNQMPQNLIDYDIPFSEGSEIIKTYPDIALSSITGKTGTAQFSYTDPSSLNKSLDKIIIKDHSGIEKKTYTFVRDKDQLLSVTDNLSPYPPIHFKYNGLTPVDDQKTDRWGYFNNGQGDDPNSYCLNGILTTIFYPTGGYKKFNYGIHTDGTHIVGGARLNSVEVEELDGNASNKYTKYYSYEDMRFTPAPIETYSIKYDDPTADNIVIATYERSYITYPLGSMEGSHVSYGKVTVLEGSSGDNGKIEYFYNNSPDVYAHTYDDPCCTDGDYPFSPPVSREWKRGLLDSLKVYRKENDQSFSLVSKTVNTYTPDPVNSHTIQSLKIGYRRIPVYHAVHLIRKTVKIESSAMLLTSSLRYAYDMNGENPIETRTDYQYNASNNLPSKIIKYLEEENKEIHKLIFYPGDYSGGYPDFLTNKHIINKPMEAVTYEWDRSVIPGASAPSDADTRVLNGKITTYDENGHKKEIWIFEPQSDVPLAITNFRFSNQLSEGLPTGTPQIFSLDSRYYKKEFSIDVYDKGIPVQTTKDDLTSSTLFSYNYTYPIAKFTNATYQEIKEKLGADTTLFTNPNPGDTYLIDKMNALRDSLPDALITSQTFEPFFSKLTTATDINGYTSYKEYDDMNRLTTVKDHEENILQYTEYDNNIFRVWKDEATDVSITLMLNEVEGATDYLFEYKRTSTTQDYQTKLIPKGQAYVIDNLLSYSGYLIKVTAKYNSTTLVYSNPVLCRTKASDPPPVNTLSVNHPSLSFTNASGSYTVQVTSNTDWTVSTNTTWLTVSKTSGSGNGNFTVSCSKNCDSQRTGTVRINYGINKSISVTQECGKCQDNCCPGRTWDPAAGKCISGD